MIKKKEMITKENLIKAGFIESIQNGLPFYTRNSFTIVRKDNSWCPCNSDFGNNYICDTYLNTMAELEQLIAEAQVQ